MTEPFHPATINLPSVLYALADPSRLKMINELARTTEIANTGFQSVQAARGTIAFHLKTLRMAGLTSTRIVTNKRMVALRRRDLDGRYPGLLDAVLRGFNAENHGIPA